MIRILTALSAIALFAVPAFAQDRDGAALPVKRIAAYPLSTCIISGEALDEDAIQFEAAGRTFKVCCKKCKAKIEADPETFAKKLDDAIIAEQSASYPLDKCVISGEKLGGMGEPISMVVDGTLVKLCCKGCIKKVKADPQAAVSKVLAAAYEVQNKNYPLDSCVVTGEKFEEGEEPVGIMVGTTLVKLCCKKCIAKVAQDPAKYVAIVRGKGVAKGTKADAAAKGSCCEDEKGEKAEKKAKGDGSCCEKGEKAEKKAG
ncbi:MAG: hypothetical protein Fur0037_04750 [Planctomycetota bacterium]